MAFATPLAAQTPSIFVVLTTHNDHQIQDLLLRNANWIIEQGFTTLVECVPCHLSNAQVSQYLLDKSKTLHIDFTPVLHNFKRTDQVKLAALSKPVDPRLSEQQIILNCELIIQALNTLAQSETIDPMLLLVLNQYKILKLHYVLNKRGCPLQGAEPINYFPRPKNLPVVMDAQRDQSILSQCLQLIQQGRKVFLQVGAAHGKNLMLELEKNRSITGSIVRLIMDKQMDVPELYSNAFFKANFPDFERNENMTACLTPELVFKKLYIDPKYSIAGQDTFFQKSFSSRFETPMIFPDSREAALIPPGPASLTPHVTPVPDPIAAAAASAAEIQNICGNSPTCNKRGAKLRCGRCKKVYYCSAKCQKEHWVTHKLDCTPAP